MSEHRLVYSTDPEVNRRCARCKEVLSECTCLPEADIPAKLVARLRLEKAKRGGKTVTVVASLPPVRSFLQGLAKELKQHCGCGGTHGVDGTSDYVEIQGDRRDAVRELLRKKGMQVKG